MESQLVPYVPRLLLDWQRETPGETWRVVEGTLVFIDLSGFTAMSEKLARKGKVGAEEVTEVLATTFSELLRVAYDVGGSLLKFGGDALLLWFSENEHAQRGTFAAAEMRRTLQKIGRIKTSSGNVTLRMTVGVHSGEFNFFLAGDSHKELIVTGPDASQTVAMESAAEAGEILLSPATSSRVDRSFLGQFKDGGCLLAKVPPPPKFEQSLSLPDVENVSGFIPKAVRRHLLGGGEEAEHRQVTIGFIKFAGMDNLITEKEAPEAAACLHSLISTVQAAVDEFEICFLSTDIDKDGGKIILTAGAPHGTENDDDRMLRALLRIRETEHGLPIQIGVHRGHVFAGSIGPFYRRSYTVMGDAVNTSARIMSRAAIGELLATKGVLDRSETAFDVEEIPDFSVKGKSRPIVASRVIKSLRPKVRAHQFELPLIGREKELEQLLDYVKAAEQGQGQVVEIVGESGIGKSRILAELRSRISTPSYEVVAQQYESSTPYFAFRGLMRTLCEIDPQGDPVTCGHCLTEKFRDVAPDLAPWLPLIASVMDAETQMTVEVERLDPEVKKSKLHEVSLLALQRLAPGPSLWIFEDIHWLDPSSKELLRYLLESCGETPWVVCMSTRPGTELLSEGIERSDVLLMSPLTSHASVTLAQKANHMLLPQHADVVARRSGGNPLFVLELVASHVAGADLGSLPENVEAVVSARIDRLEPSLRTLLRNLSVFGRETDLVTIREVFNEGAHVIDESAWPRLAEFVEVTDGALRFRQALFRDVAYEGLPFGRRRAIHGIVGGVLERRGDSNEYAELLSLHFHRALVFDKTWTYSLVAAEKAEKKSAYVAAASFYRRATECIKRLPSLGQRDVVEAWESLGLALKEAGQFLEAMEAYRRGRLEAKGDTRGLARLALLDGYARERIGQYPQALHWVTRGLRLLDAHLDDFESKKTRTRLKVAAAEIRYFQGKLKESIDWGKQAVEEARLLGDDHELGRAYYALLAAYTASGDATAVSFGERALKIFEASGDMKLQANVLNSLGMLAYYEGAWDRALDLYRRSRVALEHAGHVLGAAIATSNAAEILSDQGKLEEAQLEFESALATARATRHSRAVQVITSNLGRVAAREGKFARAHALFEQALEGFQTLGASGHVIETKLRVAETYVLEGEGHKALQILDEISGLSAPTLNPLVYRTRGYALAQSGKLVQAIDSLKESLRLARGGKQDFEVAFTLEALSRLTPVAQAHQYQDAAAEIFDRLGFVSTPAVPLSA